MERVVTFVITNLKESEQHQHPRGLGWVANTAKVVPSVYVGPWAIVYGKAQLEGKVRVLDLAQISGNVHLSGDVLVYGNCWLDGNFKANTGKFHSNTKVQAEHKRLRPAEDGL